jgi:hypothetical protein
MTAFPATAGVRAGAISKTSERSKTWAYLGLGAFILGTIVTWCIQFFISESDAKAGGVEMIEAFDKGSTQAIFRISSGVGFLVVGALVAFGVGLKRRLDERATGETLIPSLVFGSILVTAGVLAVAMSFRAQVFDGIDYYGDGESHVTLYRMSQDTVLTAWATLGAASAAFAVAGIRGYLVPKGLGWFSAVMTVLILALCLGGVPFPANIPALLWLGVVSVWAIATPDRPEA